MILTVLVILLCIYLVFTIWLAIVIRRYFWNRNKRYDRQRLREANWRAGDRRR